MIWYVLYKIPDRNGLISKRQGKETILVDSQSGIFISTEEQQDNDQSAITDFFKISKEDEALITSPRTSLVNNDRALTLKR